jgi:hypothetical protein
VVASAEKLVDRVLSEAKPSTDGPLVEKSLHDGQKNLGSLNAYYGHLSQGAGLTIRRHLVGRLNKVPGFSEVIQVTPAAKSLRIKRDIPREQEQQKQHRLAATVGQLKERFKQVFLAAYPRNLGLDRQRFLQGRVRFYLKNWRPCSEGDVGATYES